MSISNVGVYGTDVRRLTNLLIDASGAPLRGPLPLSGTDVRCLRSVSGIVDQGLVGTQLVGVESIFLIFNCMAIKPRVCTLN